MHIKKIMVSLDNLNIKRIIIVYENKIEWYTDNNYTKEQLKKIYISVVNNLIKENFSVLNGSKKEMINQLGIMRKIERNEDLLVSSINYDKDKYIVYYNEGLYREEFSKSEFYKVLEELNKEYDFNIEELTINKLENIGLLKNNKKVKNLKINKRTISMLIALGMMGGIFGGFKLSSKLNNKYNKDSIEIWHFDEEVKPDITPYQDPNELEKLNIIEEDNINTDEKKINYNQFGLVSSKLVISGISICLDYFNNRNFLENVTECPYLTTTSIDSNTFKIIKTNSGYDSILNKIGKQYNEGCYDYSILYTNGILNNSECSCNFESGLTNNAISTENEQRILQIAARELLEGRPCIIRVNGIKKGNGYSRHFVVVVGLKENYDLNNLKQSDFLIADPTSAGLKILDTEYGGMRRFLLKTKDDINWRNNVGDSEGYVIVIANDIKKYFGLDLHKGVLPWVTYIPEDNKIL